MSNYLNLKVEELTTPNPITTTPDMPIKVVESILRQGGFRHIPVVDKGKVIGIISEREVKMVGRLWNSFNICAKDIMTEDPYTVLCTDLLVDVTFELSKRKINSAVVLCKDYIGIFTSTDALNALVEVLRSTLVLPE